ncbi:hypothetical protein QTJ16_006410 [Diplocarpon rosae]|uniref:GAF domain-containing protein n=1 Tax=Diplocarpon rosae TaxID=946125 RepID=A0AAD9SVI7_9HELO|nr:hypothetical protein QTJ16_006410 [Diplocarpon rosae]
MESSLVSWPGDHSFDMSLNQLTSTEIGHADSFRKQARDEPAKTGGITKDLIEFFEHTDPTGPPAADPARLEATLSASQESFASTQGIDLTNLEEAGSTSHLVVTQSLNLSRKENKKRGLVAKMFSRSSASSSKKSLEKEGQIVADQGVQDGEAEEGNLDATQPAHYLKPLQHRMQARKETGMKPPKRIEDAEATISPITIARNRGEAARRLQGNFDEEAVEYDLASPKVQSVMGLVMSAGVGAEDGPESSLEVSGDRAVDDEEQVEEEIEEEVNLLRFHELDDVILDLCPGGKWDEQWDSYMTSYSNGQFNLSNPPKPPALKDKFEFLPSVYPPNEPQRLGMSDDFDVLWPHWGQDNSAELIRIAMTKFGAKSVSLSFFDEENEVFKAENGYNQSHVARTTSIAAHCLLSKDVLVVLDTKEDWRFRHNPLVSGRPKIRFFAGAPMMAPCGEVLGVFAIFSSKPRLSFTPLQCRELAEFSCLVMEDLRNQVDELAERYRLTPLLDRDTFIAPNHSVRTLSAQTVDGAESELVPSALSFQKSKASQRPRSQLYYTSGTHRVQSGPIEQTPPSSAESNLNFYADSPELEKDDGHFNAGSSTSKHLSPCGSYLSGLDAFSPRPFSSSDITSLHPHPPNTPARSLIEDLSIKPQFDLTAEDFVIGGDSSAKSYRQITPSTNPFYEGYTGDLSESENARALGRRSSATMQQQELAANNSTSRNKRVGYAGSTVQASNTHQRGSSAGRSTATPRDVSTRSTPGRDGRSGIPGSDLIELGTPSTTESSRGKHNHKLPPRRARTSAFSSAPPAPFPDMIEGFPDEAAFTCEINAQNLGYDMVYAVNISPARPGMSDEEMLASDGLRTEILVAYGLSRPLVLSPVYLLRVLQSKRAEHWTDPAAKREAGEYYSGRLVPITSDGRCGIIMGAFRFPGNISQDGNVGSPAEMEELWDFSEVLGAVLLRKSRKRPKRSHTEPTGYVANEVRRAIVGNMARHRRS